MAGGTRAPLLPELRLLPGRMHRTALVTPVARASPEVAGDVGTSAGTGGPSLLCEREVGDDPPLCFF